MNAGIITTLLASLSLGTACNKDAPTSEPATATAPPTAKPAALDRLEITVTEDGFKPEDVKVPANKPVTLVFTRKTDNTCAKEVVMTMSDGSKIERKLPLNEPVEVATTFPTAGTIGYACGMDMMKGTVTVQ